ncbi:Bacterial regulatory protein, LacI family [Micromonospora sp. MW-13]|nr:Bacterial regulatory protein, LacI family [Micromonospora sp. MW-13]
MATMHDVARLARVSVSTVSCCADCTSAALLTVPTLRSRPRAPQPSLRGGGRRAQRSCSSAQRASSSSTGRRPENISISPRRS